jgi:hypothetical protein
VQPQASHIALLSPNLAELLSDVAATVELPDVQQVFVDSLVEFIARYLEAVGPSAIAIDDAHWLDHGSRIVVSLLVARIRAGGHLLVYAARDEPVHRRTVELLRTALPPDNLTSLRLGPMSQGELSGLVAEYLSSVAAPDPEMVRQLATLTDGTPLSALELLRLALEQGYLNQHDGVWRLESAIHKMQLPGSSRELIARRVARMATSRRRFRPMAQPDSSSRMFSLVSTQPVVWNRIPATPTTPFGVRRSVPSKPATMYWRWRFCDRPSRPRGTRTFCQTETSTSSLPRLVYGRASTMQASPISKLHSHAPAPGMNAHTCSAALPGYTIATPMPTDAGLRYPLDCQSLAALRLSAVTESY